jgi:phosphate transport system protein
MLTPHILHDFDHAISTLRGETLAMAGKARHNLERACRALLERNVELANAVIADDDDMNEHERHIDQLGMEILARFKPVAPNLRLVVSSMKISMNIKHISDDATGIAKRAKKVSASHELQDTTLIEPLYTLVDHLLRDAISAYSDRNATLAASLPLRDKQLERMHQEATATFGSRIEQSNGRCHDYLHLILVIRSLKRIGDLAVNIGEDAVLSESTSDPVHAGNRALV